MFRHLVVSAPAKMRLFAATALAAALPLVSFARTEEAMIWSEKTNGTSTALAYGSINPAENPLFILSCFNGMSIAVLDVHKEIEGAKPGQALTIELASTKAQSPVEGEVTQNDATGKTFAEATDIEVKPLLEILRDPGPVTVKMGETSVTLSDQGRAEAVSRFSRNCEVE